MEEVLISPETIMELMAEKEIMPESIYQRLLTQEDCQKHRKLLSATTMFVMGILKNYNIRLDLDSILILSAIYYIKVVGIIAD